MLDQGYEPEELFDRVHTNRYGFERVTLHNKWNYLDYKINKLLSNQWFDWACNFTEDGFALVELNDEYNYIDKNGNFLSEQWFKKAYEFRHGFADVVLNGKWYEIDKNGELTPNAMRQNYIE